MDLLELNDIYCKDKARIEHDPFFTKSDLKIECRFTPLEDPFYRYTDNTMEGLIDVVICNPFDKVYTDRLEHSVGSFMDILSAVPVTSYYNNETKLQTPLEDRLDAYCNAVTTGLQCHPDYVLSDIIPGMTLISDLIRNQNFYLVPEYAVSNVEKAFISNDLLKDARSLSLIYLKDDGSKIFGYGAIIYAGQGLTSLSDSLKKYLLANTYIISRSPYADRFNGLKSLKTVCNILYEDSIKRIIDMDEGEN